jgi:deaminated glutathione amidase
MPASKTPKTIISAVIQMNSGDDKLINLARAECLIREAAVKGAKLAVLPELFSWRGPLKDMKKVSEPVPGPTIARLSHIALDNKISILAGSIVERSSHKDKVYNTSVFIGFDGHIRASYRKIHLFQYRSKNGGVIREDRVFLPGDRISYAQLSGCMFGLSICYDLRFPGLYRALTGLGCRAFLAPSAFTFETGVIHWEVLLRARAIENQSYILAPNQCGMNHQGFADYGHSMIIGPLGEVLGVASQQEDIVIAEINLSYVNAVRKQLPTLKHIRTDAYRIKK